MMPQQQRQGPWPPPEWLQGLVLAAAIILSFEPVRRAGFIWDDTAYVTENKLLSTPGGLRLIWFSRESPSQYFPLVYSLFWLEHKLWGLNPAGYHWINLLLHTANALLVWRLLKRLAIPGAWLAAALFALHPVQVETVAWVTEAKNLLSLFFYLLAVWAWVEFVSEDRESRIEDGSARSLLSSILHPLSSRWSFYAIALFCFLLALFSKTTACTLPVALLLSLWLKHIPINARRLAQVSPFFALGLCMGLLTIWWERHHIGTSGGVFAIGWLERLLIASRSVWFYLGKLVWPANLIFSYPRWTIDLANLSSWLWLVLLLAFYAAIYFSRRRLGRAPEIALIFYVVTLAPTLGFIMLYTFRYTFVADHYQYVACIGPLAVVAAGVTHCMRACVTIRAGRAASMALSAAVLVALATLTWRQSAIYHDSEILWRTTLARNPDSFLAEYQLGNALFQKGDFEEGVTHYQKYLQAQPSDADAHYNLGNVFFSRGQSDQAIAEYEKTLQIKPRDAEAHNNLGASLARKGRFDEAIKHFREALAIRPGFEKAANNLNEALSLKARETNKPR